MGLPEIIIDFKTAGATAIRRSGRGTVGLLVSGSGAAQSFSSLSQAEGAGLSPENFFLVRLCFLGGPASVKLVFTGTDVQAGLEQAARAALGGWLCAPELDGDTVAAFMRNRRKSGEALRCVVANATAPDNEGIVNFMAEGLSLTLDDTAVPVTAAQYAPRIAGILAGLSLTRSATYYPLPEATDFTPRADPDSDVEAGRLILCRGAGGIRLGRGVNSLTTLSDAKGSAFQKIKIAEGIDLIRQDIRTAFETGYIGQVLNDYDSKLLLVTAVNGYLAQLEGSVLDAAYDNRAEIDLSAQQTYLLSQGIDTKEMTETQILKANTGSQVFLAAALRFVDAMEDLYLQVRM